MLKFQPLVTTGAAALLMMPALSGDDDIASLQSALQSTEHALGILRSLEERVEEGAGDAAELVKRVTEPSMADGPARDARLEGLRQEIGVLQFELDVLESRTLPPIEQPPQGPAGPILGPGEHPAQIDPIGPITTGLSPTQLQALGSGSPLPTQRSKPASTASGGPSPRTTGATSAEGEGYSADPMRHARTLLRARRFQEGFDLIKHLSDPEAHYLQARLLERLGRIDEAISLLEGVIGKLTDSYDAQRAQSDLEFFRWKREFLNKMPELKGREGDAKP